VGHRSGGDGGNMGTMGGISRSRWKIENEQYNTYKNRGYEL